MIYILAGNIKEAKLWADNGNLNRDDWRFLGVDGIRTLRGLTGPIIFARVGTFYMRKDLQEVINHVNIVNATAKQ